MWRRQRIKDQINSIRRFVPIGCGPLVKEIDYDSFGNVIRETRPRFRFPLGFACGLNDPFTGFVRFGYRDYFPEIGRFTTKDPLGLIAKIP